MRASNAGGVGRNRYSEHMAWLPVLTLQQADVVNAVAGGARPTCRKLWRIAGSKRRCWLPEKTTKCLWQEASTLRQRQQNSAFNCTQWQICSLQATFHYSSHLQTWLQTWFTARFSTSSCEFATCFRLFCRKPGREPAASISTCRDWCSRFVAHSLLRMPCAC